MSEIFKPINGRKYSTEDWNDYTLLIPCVSVGNVPQLTTDLLISTLIEANDCQLCGYIYSSALMPLSGPDPYRINGQIIATSSQLFECNERKLLIIQQRTPLFKELRKEFYESLSKWLSRHRLNRILILTSSFIEHLVSALTSGDCYPLKYLTNKTFKEDEQQLKEYLKCESVERVDEFSLESTPEGVIHIPGSGSAKSLLKQFDKYSIPAIALVLYCSEGDNRPHAFSFADRINEWLNLIDNKSSDKKKPWIVPFSWRLLFGDEAPKTIY